MNQDNDMASYYDYHNFPITDPQINYVKQLYNDGYLGRDDFLEGMFMRKSKMTIEQGNRLIRLGKSRKAAEKRKQCKQEGGE